MKRLQSMALAAAMLWLAGPAVADSLSVQMQAGSANPAGPQMGDNLTFHSTVRNDGSAPVEGLVAWLSLIEIDPGNEQPMDLEDWSAHKAISVANLAPGGVVETDWPMRLIQPGRYRVVINAMSRGGTVIAASPFSDFAVREKPVVESGRVLPVAFGVPGLLCLFLLWRLYRGRLRRAGA